MSTSLTLNLTTNKMTRLDLTQALANGSGHRDTLDAVLEAFQSNHSVRDVYLGPYFYASLGEQSRAIFIERLGQDLQNLTSLSVGTLEHTKACISSEALGKCVAKAMHLHTLHIERDVILASAKDTEQFATGLCAHSTLRRVSLLSLRPTCNEASSLDSLLLSLSSISNLESLQLGISADCRIQLLTMTPSGVASLATKARYLSWLYMERFPLTDQHLLVLFESIGAHDTSLKVLDFPKSHNLTASSWDALAHLLQTNATLESVSMFAPPEAKSTKALVYSYLALNRDGKRQRLRDCKDLDTWIEIASRLVGRELNIVYTIVRENPFICNFLHEKLN